MKTTRILALIFALALISLPALASAPAKLSADDFVFMFDDLPYAPGSEAAPLISAIEARFGPMDVMEMESCLFSGQDKEFSSDEIVLGTYPIGPGGSDQLETILVVGGAHQTARGVSIGMTRRQVIDAYGEDFLFDYDQMTYAMGDPLTHPVLVFVIDLETDCVSAFYMMRNSG